MILTMDVGNTNIKFGVFDGDTPVFFWRVSTAVSRTSDEYGAILHDLFTQNGVRFQMIEAAVISSVAPAINYTLYHTCKDYLGIDPYVVNCDSKTGLTLRYDNPADLGTDRIVGAAAAYKLYGGPVIVVDFGSATTFNLVTRDAEFIGGAIAPGIKTAAESLVTAAAKLPRIDLTQPESVVGTSTRTCMQSGIIFGYTGLVKYLIERYRALDRMKDATVVATGGLSELIEGVEPHLIDKVDRALALKGLKIIYEMNKNDFAQDSARA